MSEPTRTSTPDEEYPTATLGPTAGGEVGPRGTPPGYELLTLIGSGGMGVVYRARELALARDVAVKILQDRFGPNSAAAARFLDEARITGQLQHPGIPPIHHVGTLADGRPFLAMKLIKGRTLAEILADASEGYGTLIAVFEQVAQAVGYAHAHGVIHRDLKPANVMVGSFGEVQVMDWGLAKVLGVGQPREVRPDAATVGTEIRSLRDGGDMTQAGSLLGTPAYMAPEQAIGTVDLIDKRSDVFGLGGMLCAILTGLPPYVGADAESTRHLAARAKLDEAFARLDACGAEPELVVLCKRCLAPEPGDRPADAGEVAEAVAALRADAERRARQAEMDRAKADVRAAEERKRRRVQRALALSVLVLFAVAGFAGWWIESVRSARRADQLTREAELKDRQLAYERNLKDAIDEAELFLSGGRRSYVEEDDLNHWSLALDNASAPLERAERLIKSGDPPEELRRAFAAARDTRERDARDRDLIVELDRIADGNEMRQLLIVTFTGDTARRYEAAFRKYGIDLLGVPTAEAAAWLKAHRLRDRLVTAIRTWGYSLPATEVILVAAPGGPTGAPAAAGGAAAAALAYRPGRGVRIRAILNAVTDDPFAREWWAAVERRDAAALKQLVSRPEVRRMSSRELASLADGLGPFSGTIEALGPLLEIAYEKFPGEFWVHFRLAFQADFAGKDADEREKQEQVRRHLTAALAIRPNSAVARAAVGMEILERKKDDPAGLRMLRSAAEADPTSPWPHLLVATLAVEQDEWPEAFRAFKEAVRLDPDTSYFMIQATVFLFPTFPAEGVKRPPAADLLRFIEELIRIQSRHPGGYYLLGSYHYQSGDHRAALAAFREGNRCGAPDYPARAAVAFQVEELEAEARVEEELLPGALSGEAPPGDGPTVVRLAGYCATFEKKYALATRFAAEGLESFPNLRDDWMNVGRFAGWAVQAGLGNGADADATPLIVRERCRRLALEWMRETVRREGENAGAMAFHLNGIRDFDPVRDPTELAKLPPGERAGWEQVWAAVNPAVAPPPRPKQ